MVHKALFANWKQTNVWLPCSRCTILILQSCFVILLHVFISYSLLIIHSFFFFTFVGGALLPSHETWRTCDSRQRRNKHVRRKEHKLSRILESIHWVQLLSSPSPDSSLSLFLCSLSLCLSLLSLCLSLSLSVSLSLSLCLSLFLSLSFSLYIYAVSLAWRSFDGLLTVWMHVYWCMCSSHSSCHPTWNSKISKLILKNCCSMSAANNDPKGKEPNLPNIESLGPVSQPTKVQL